MNNQEQTTFRASVSAARWGLSIVFVLLFLIGLTFAVWFFQREVNREEESSKTLQEMRRLREFVMYTNAAFPPMEFYRQEGRWEVLVGFDVDIGSRIAAELGLRASVEHMSAGDLFATFDEGKAHAIISSVPITKELQERYSFSTPYLTVDQVILVRKDESAIRSPEDLFQEKVGVRIHSMNEREASVYAREAFVSRYDTFREAVDALISGKVRAVIADLPAAQWEADENPSVKLVEYPFPAVSYGIVFRKQDEDVRELVNKIIEDMGRRRAIREFERKWLQ